MPKLRLRILGVPLYMLALLDPVRTIAVTRRSLKPLFMPPDVEIVYDPGLGPVRAIAEALKRIDEDIIVIRPVDMPFLTRERIEEHIENKVKVFASDKIHRVASIWPREVLSERIKEAYKMSDLYEGIEYEIIKLEKCEGLNINTPEDLVYSLECLKESHRGI